MIKLEKLEKGEFFEDAFLVSYRYNKDYLNKMRSLKYKRYVPDKKAWEIPSSELKHLVRVSLAVKSTVLSVGLNIGDL